jgi:hypothetical protein
MQADGRLEIQIDIAIRLDLAVGTTSEIFFLYCTWMRYTGLERSAELKGMAKHGEGSFRGFP